MPSYILHSALHFVCFSCILYFRRGNFIACGMYSRHSSRDGEQPIEQSNPTNRMYYNATDGRSPTVCHIFFCLYRNTVDNSGSYVQVGWVDMLST